MNFLKSLLPAISLLSASATSAELPTPIFKPAPLAEKPFSELPLGSIKPDAWFLDELAAAPAISTKAGPSSPNTSG
jgi:hypothetical protein